MLPIPDDLSLDTGVYPAQRERAREPEPNGHDVPGVLAAVHDGTPPKLVAHPWVYEPHRGLNAVHSRPDRVEHAAQAHVRGLSFLAIRYCMVADVPCVAHRDQHERGDHRDRD